MRNRTVTLLVCCAAVVCSSVAHAGLDNLLRFRAAALRGYVFIASKPVVYIKTIMPEQELSRRQLLDACLDRWNDKKPFAGARVSIEGTEKFSEVRQDGSFEISPGFFDRLMNRRLVLQSSSPALSVTFSPAADPDGGSLSVVNIAHDGTVSIGHLKAEGRSEATQKAVFLVHGLGIDIFDSRSALHTERWRAIRQLLDADPEMAGHACFMLRYNDNQDIVKSSRGLSRAVACARDITGQPLILLGYSLGGLVCRHYTVSDWYAPGSVERYLMIGTPNHGANQALLHFDAFGSGEHEAERQLLTTSDFIRALNGQGGDELARRFGINPALRDSRGLNRDIACAVIAGEVVQKTVRELRAAGQKTALTAEILLDKFIQALADSFGIRIDSERVKAWLYELLEPIVAKIGRSLDSVPGSDLIVALDSARIDGVPCRVIPYTHGRLLDAGGRDDIRYRLIKDFIIKGAGAIADEPVLLNAGRAL